MRLLDASCLAGGVANCAIYLVNHNPIFLLIGAVAIAVGLWEDKQ